MEGSVEKQTCPRCHGKWVKWKRDCCMYCGYPEPSREEVKRGTPAEPTTEVEWHSETSEPEASFGEWSFFVWRIICGIICAILGAFFSLVAADKGIGHLIFILPPLLLYLGYAYGSVVLFFLFGLAAEATFDLSHSDMRQLPTGGTLRKLKPHLLRRVRRKAR